jgi:hypothetical protein
VRVAVGVARQQVAEPPDRLAERQERRDEVAGALRHTQQPLRASTTAT